MRERRINFLNSLNIIIAAFFLIIQSNPQIQNTLTLWYVAICFVFFGLLVNIINKRLYTRKLNKSICLYVIWYSILICVISFSSLYSNNILYGLDLCLTLGVELVFFLFIVFSSNSIFNSIILIKLKVISTFLLSLYIIIVLKKELFSGARLGISLLGIDWNANEIGIEMMYSCFLVIILLHNKKLPKVIGLSLLCLFLFLGIVSGSRKVFIGLIIFIVLYFHNKLSIKYIVLSIICISVLMYCVFSIPLFFKIMGSRIESLFGFGGFTDLSTKMRINLIKEGLQGIIAHPIFGNGARSFEINYFIHNGILYYSHNNYIELLYCYGIIGFSVYYSIYIILLSRYRLSLSCKNQFVIYFIIVLLIMDIGMVSYYEFNNNFYLFLCFYFLNPNSFFINESGGELHWKLRNVN